MRPINSNRRWFAAAVCLLASSGFAAAQEGVVRISDAATRPGVVRMNETQPQVQQTAFGGNMYQTAYSAGGCDYDYGCCPPADYGCCPPCDYGCCPPDTYGCCPPSCGTEGCCDSDGNCCYGSECDCYGNGCDCYGCPSGCDAYNYGRGHRRRMVTLFARAVPKDQCNSQRWGKRWCRGQQLNYLNRNQRLANHLFGWLVPSGCCGQGCPPFGKYTVTYADDPGYADARDTGPAYGAQGYGVPMTVPLAPTVRHAYNYSWGTPASRITPMGTYSPEYVDPQPLYHQSW